MLSIELQAGLGTIWSTHGLLKRWMKNYKSIVPNKGLICEHCMLWFTLDLHFYPLGAGFWAKRYEHDFLRIINLMTCTCFQTTRTIWLVSSPSESQEKSRIREIPRKLFFGKDVRTNIVWDDNNVWKLLCLDHQDHLDGVQPLQQPGVEPDQGHTQEAIFGQRCRNKSC